MCVCTLKMGRWMCYLLHRWKWACLGSSPDGSGWSLGTGLPCRLMVEEEDIQYCTCDVCELNLGHKACIYTRT